MSPVPMNLKFDVQPAYILSSRPNALICCDIHGKMPRSTFGHQYIFVMYDMFSKFTKIYPMRAISTRGCLKKILGDYVPKYGPISALISDNASLFSSPIWRKALEESNIKCFHPSVYHPQSNPAERSLRNITIYLRAYCHRNHKNWYSYCPIIEAILNRTPNPSTQVSPGKLMTGNEPESMFTGVPESIPATEPAQHDEVKRVYERLLKRAEKRALKMKRYKKTWDIQIGDQVLARLQNLSCALKGRNHKMELLYSELRTVTQKFGSDTFELTDARGRKARYHKSKLRKFVT